MTDRLKTSGWHVATDPVLTHSKKAVSIVAPEVPLTVKGDIVELPGLSQPVVLTVGYE